jgi:hypothetical protein
MIDEIRKRLDESPYQPFALRTADGREYLVPTVDHIYLPPGGRRVFVTDDEGVTVGLAPLLIAGIVYDLPRRKRAGRRKS